MLTEPCYRIVSERGQPRRAIKAEPLARGGLRCRGCGIAFRPNPYCSLSLALSWHLEASPGCREFYARLDGELVRVKDVLVAAPLPAMVNPGPAGHLFLRSTLYVDRHGGRPAILGITTAGKRVPLATARSAKALRRRLEAIKRPPLAS